VGKGMLLFVGNMNKQTNIMRVATFFLVSVLIFFTGCNQKCVPLDKSLLGWVPYSINDTLKFSNNHFDSLSFVVNEKSISDDNTIYGRWEKYACHSQISFNAISLVDSGSVMHLGIIYPDFNKVYFMFSFSHNNKYGSFSLHTTDINKNIISSLEIDNQVYNNVIILSIDTIKHPNQSGFWKAIISQNIGVVKIYEKGNNNIWTFNK
jgi:hypothetical protein